METQRQRERINDPPQLINFSRTTRDITGGQIPEFYDQITSEKCKSGMFLSTSKFNSRAENASSAKMIGLYDSDFIVKAIEKIKSKKKVGK